MEPTGIVVSSSFEGRSLYDAKPQLQQCLQLTHGHLLYISGIGAQKAHHGALSLIKQGAKRLISWGTAGGLDPALTPGTLLLPDEIISSDHDSIPTDETWTTQWSKQFKGYPLAKGRLLQSHQVISKKMNKHALFQQYRAQGVDMESFSVAKVAYEHQVPFLCVRAIIDSALNEIPPAALKAMDREGNIHVFRFIQALFGAPNQVTDVIRLFKGFLAAKKTLKMAAPLALTP